MESKEGYEKQIKEKLQKLKGKAKPLGAAYAKIKSYHYSFYYNSQDEFKDQFVALLFKHDKNMQDLLDGGLSDLFSQMLAPDVAGRLSKIILRLPQYNYQSDMYRRSFKSKEVRPYTNKIMQIIREVFFDWSKFDLYTYLTKTQEQIKEEKYALPSQETLSHLIALEIDEGNQAVIKAIEEIILSENNTRSVDHILIRGISRSHHKELHELMVKLLLAAKLQEGLRQAIFETADDGCLEYFLLMMHTALENNMLRFSSCLRAVGVWMGLGYGYEDKRVVEKQLKAGYLCLTDDKARKEYMASRDMTELYGAMWAESVFSIENAREHVEKLMGGPKYQQLAALYMLRHINEQSVSAALAAKYFDAGDPDILAYVLSNYNLSGGWANSKEKYQENCQANTILKDKKTRDLHFEGLIQTLERIPKNGLIVREKPFPWCYCEITRQQVYQKLLIITGYDGDAKKVRRLIELTAESDSSERINMIKYFIEPERSKEERQYLFDCLSDRSMPVRIQAVKEIQKLQLTEGEITTIEDLLKLKTGEIRQIALEILGGQEQDQVQQSLERLLKDKMENKRLGGLDMLATQKKEEKLGSEEIAALIKLMPKSTSRENIMIDNLMAKSQPQYNAENGFGLYNPEYRPVFDPIKSYGKYILKDFRKAGAKQVISYLKSLTELIEQHKDYTYTRRELWNDSEHEVVLGSAKTLFVLAENERKEKDYTIDDYPLADVWKKWFKKSKADLLTLLKINYASRLKNYRNVYEMSYTEWAQKLIKKQLGFEDVQEIIHWCATAPFGSLALQILQILYREFPEKDRFILNHDLLVDFMGQIKAGEWKKPLYDPEKRRTYYGGWRANKEQFITDAREFQFFLSHMEDQADDGLFLKNMAICYELGKLQDMQYLHMDERDIARGVKLGAVDENELYRTFIRQNGPGKMATYTSPVNALKKKNIEEFPILEKVTQDVVARVIEIELTRGDSQTPVSAMAQSIRQHYGLEKFAEILVALGNETLARGYSYSSNYTKKDVLSSLLKACVPNPGDNAQKLKKALNGRIKDKRLLDAAMYAPRWIAIAQDYLGWKGLKSAAWYFHAHTSNSFSAEFETEVARYSPITREEFQDGAFDIKWFKEAYKTLGKERFDMLYDSAKYISDGTAHRRAQLFADAVLGKLDASATKEEIAAKRNKDKMLSYSLIPFGKNKMNEGLERYEFIQQFLKQSKQFGAQRRASEGKVCGIALENLARNLGFEDALRFTWKMEVLKIGQIKAYFKPHKLEDVSVYIETNETGQAEIAVMKGEKRLKAVPAKLKKDPYIEDLKEIKASLKAQFSRARASLEKAMENQDEFKYAEILDLLKHPVIKPLVEKLVFKTEAQTGFLSVQGITDAKGNTVALKKSDKLTIAHCYDLYSMGVWRDYQRYAFDNQLVQPFKQIFRELYIINADEQQEKTISRRYAGHQVQPKRTLGLLKSRNWTVDYDNGLQKVYYKENVIATIYAMADWFSPADIEAPTLETVMFLNRKTIKPVAFEDISPVVFSETMRDVDLVVSVAHAGGVDPMASHSTMEMRAVVCAELARLLKLDNVKIENNHVHIKGTLGEYNIHLGSGIAHQMGKGALNILPVHSQHRGRIFLPFLDEDPRTAEITSKMLLLAEDQKIKDPSILAQIRG